MTVAEFLAWGGDGSGRTLELVDGEVRAQDPASDTHGTIDGNLSFLIGAHLRVHRPNCRVVVQPGIRPRLRANWNYRVPELGVTCAPNQKDAHMMPEPILLIEILSPKNRKDTWNNVPLFASVPSVQEIVLVDSESIQLDVLRRAEDGSWPTDPTRITTGQVLELHTIGLELPLPEIYRGTHLQSR